MAVKILQIIPATDWYAKYDEEGTAFFEPIACWALIDKGGETVIEGMVPVENSMVPCKETAGFIEIVPREKVGD